MLAAGNGGGGTYEAMSFAFGDVNLGNVTDQCVDWVFPTESWIDTPKDRREQGGSVELVGGLARASSWGTSPNPREDKKRGKSVEPWKALEARTFGGAETGPSPLEDQGRLTHTQPTRVVNPTSCVDALARGWVGIPGLSNWARIWNATSCHFKGE